MLGMTAEEAGLGEDGVPVLLKHRRRTAAGAAASSASGSSAGYLQNSVAILDNERAEGAHAGCVVTQLVCVVVARLVALGPRAITRQVCGVAL